MLAGDLDKHISFDRPTTTKGAVGGHREPGWEPVAEDVWANVRPTGSNERLAAYQMQSGQTHVVTVRYNPALVVARGDWSIRLGTRRFDVVGLPRNLDEANKWLVFDCAEGSIDDH